MDRKTRVRLIAQHPGVTTIAVRIRCTAQATSTKRQCGNWAYWKFTPLKSSQYAQAGTYCYGHLADHGIYADDAEHTRTERFVRRLKAKGEWPE